MMAPAALSAALTGFLENKLGARVSKAFSFKQIQINNGVIHIKSYQNVSRRNSNTVEVDELGFLEG